MANIIRYPTLLIFCLRAEPKIKFVKDAQGKTQIVDAGYQPICERMFGYEMLAYALVHADNPGVPQQLKKLEPELESVFLAGQQIDESTGERLAAWAKASAAPTTGNQTDTGEYITADQHIVIMDELKGLPNGEERLKKKAGVDRLTKIPRKDYQRTLEYIAKAKNT